MDSRLATFRPEVAIQKRSLPSVPPTIPSDPGYARPFVGQGGLPRPPDPPPTPPTELQPARPPQFYDPPLETSLDDDTTALNAVTRGRRSRSVGQMLETNFDDDEGAAGGGGPQESTPLKNNGHSRSLGGSGLFKLSVAGEAPLETDM